MDVDMGTYEEAKDRFLSACDRWIAARQPLMANAAAHKHRAAEEHEAKFQLANAAIHLAWHMRNKTRKRSVVNALSDIALLLDRGALMPSEAATRLRSLVEFIGKENPDG